MNHRPRPGGLIYGAVSVILCSGITIGGVRWAADKTQEPEIPAPAITAPVLAIPAAKESAITAADLWSDDRSRIDTPLLDVPLEAETQWAIFERCGQDAELFCAVMAIASVESDFDPQMVGDDGDSIGMMQINTRWHMGRMEALGVTDLTDPVQCAAVAIDYLLELEGILEAGPEDHRLYVGYNCGPSRAKRTSSTAYSETVMEIYQEYIDKMGGYEILLNFMPGVWLPTVRQLRKLKRNILKLLSIRLTLTATITQEVAQVHRTPQTPLLEEGEKAND